MSRLHRHGSLTVALCCGVAAIGLLSLPIRYQQQVRSIGRDIAIPSIKVTTALCQWSDSNYPGTVEKNDALTISKANVDFQKREFDLLQRCRDLELKNAELTEQLAKVQRWGASQYQVKTGEPALTTQLVEAHVLNKTERDELAAELIVDRGLTSGMREALWAICQESVETIIDQGENEELQVGQTAFRGRTVVGRIASVGQWTSTLQPVTAADFRCPVQLVSRTDSGTRFGAKGQFEGTGEALCRLKWIGPQESVSVGDLVFTDREHEGLSAPMYFGKVTKAELEPGALEWSIWVEPAASLVNSGSVQIVRRSVNRSRILAQ